MDPPLLATKLFIPPTRPDIVARPRLTEQIDRGLHRKLTLISAPAGSGKTTLMTAWIDNLQLKREIVGQQGTKVAWLSLDESDNDTARFFSYLITALQSWQAELGESTLALIGSSPSIAIEPMLTPLLNELSQLEGKLVLILDDYHLIHTAEIHQAVVFLLEHSPPQFHIMIATRADPPLHLPLFRAQDHITEIKGKDLGFNLQETRAFLTDLMGISIAEGDVHLLMTRIEGWIAGLQMAALSLMRREDQGIMIKNFSGNSDFVTEYLTDEVLSHQADNVWHFLLETSILNRLSGPLCEAVTDQSDSGKILSQLKQQNLFIIPLDDQGLWYRYHHLFADLLRQRLSQSNPELVPTLHNRARQWYQEQGMLEEAIDHALAAKEPALAASLVEQVADRMMRRSEIRTLLKWIELLPRSEIQARPLLNLYQVGAQLMSGYPVDDLKSSLGEIPNKNIESTSGEISTIRALIASFQGDTSKSLVHTRQALEFLPEDSKFLRSSAAQNIGFAFAARGDVTGATQAFQEAAHLADQAGSPLISVISLSHIAELEIAQGRLKKAELTYQKALKTATDKTGNRFPISGMPLIGLGELRRERNQLDNAYQFVQEGLIQTEQWSIISTIDGHLTLARIYEALGNPGLADAEIQAALDQSIAFDATEVDDLMVAYHKARIWIRRGEPDMARQWLCEQENKIINEYDKDFISGYFFIDLLRLTTHIRLELSSGQARKALTLLKQHQDLAANQGLKRSLIEGYLLEALSHQSLGLNEQALDALKKALQLAEDEKFLRLFLDEGPPLSKLLYRAAEQKINPQYTGYLLAAFAAEQHTERPRFDGLIKALTDRELEVLTLISKGLTNQEIANHLVITLRTVKWHSSNIYGKLQVKNRTEAVARARSIGILPIE